MTLRTPSIRSHIQQMPPYEPVLPAEILAGELGIPASQVIKLDANENPYGPPPAVQQALSQLQNAHIYPDPQARKLRQALAAYHQLPYENLLAGAGADDLIDLLLRLFIDPGDGVLTCPPTFGMYAFDAGLQRARLVMVPRKPDFSLDLPAIERAVAHYRPKLLFLATPNNPDGSLVPRESLERLLALPLLLVLDEAYIEFAPPGSSLLAEVPARKNLVVLRTFSKWGGLAGLRVGYGAFPGWLVPHLWKIKQPYAVSAAASAAAMAAVSQPQVLEAACQRILSERQRLFAALSEIPWLQPFPTQSNFILCRVTGRSAQALKNRLAAAGIFVRYFKRPGLDDCIRISVGRPAHSDALLAALRSITETKPFEEA